jgi:hypothetical protein
LARILSGTNRVGQLGERLILSLPATQGRKSLKKRAGNLPKSEAYENKELIGVVLVKHIKTRCLARNAWKSGGVSRAADFS